MTDAARLTLRNCLIVAVALLALQAAVLFAMGRVPICTCGTVKLWGGGLGSDNSQHVADWYTLSHVIHGFLFYGLGWLLLRRRPLGERFVAAVAIEAAWEVVENSKYIIDRYREATIALGYTGDSILNSLSDIGWMVIGFLLASRMPVWASVALAVALELFTLAMIRDNLTLNILMLVWPIPSIAAWQAGA